MKRKLIALLLCLAMLAADFNYVLADEAGATEAVSVETEAASVADEAELEEVIMEEQEEPASGAEAAILEEEDELTPEKDAATEEQEELLDDAEPEELTEAPTKEEEITEAVIISESSAADEEPRTEAEKVSESSATDEEPETKAEPAKSPATRNVKSENRDGEDDREVLESGSCGENLTWVVYDTGELEISGEGNMTNYAYNSPFSSFSDTIVSVSLGNGITSIGVTAFYDCSMLTEIRIPDGVTSIGDYAFSGCNRLTSVTIPDGVTSIGKGAFSDCFRLTDVRIPDGVTCIEEEVFSNCSSLTEITIPDGVTYIGYMAFSYCSSLREITIPDGMTDIGVQAFSYCSSLRKVVVLSNTINIGDGAFLGSDPVLYGAIGSDTEQYAYDNGFAFIEYCEHQHTSTIPAVEPTCTSVGYTEGEYCSDCGKYISGHVLIEKLPHTDEDGDGVCEVCGRRTVAVVAEGVCGKDMQIERIYLEECDDYQFVFTGGENLTWILYEDRELVISGEGEMFSGNDVYGCLYPWDGDLGLSFKKLTIKEGVTTIGKSAFVGNYGLEEAFIPHSVVSIGAGAFTRCGNLAEAYILNENAEIGEEAFEECYGLTIYGYRGSTAEAYARDYGYRFIVYCLHANTEEVPASDPTCSKYGYTAGVYCHDCREYLSGHDWIGEKLPHTDENSDGICDICGRTMSEWSGNATEPKTLVKIDGVRYYQIFNASELAFIAETGGDWLGYNYVLANDIIINDVKLEYDNDGALTTDKDALRKWNPINGFKGILRGDGHAISGMYVETDGEAGLLTSFGGDVYDLNIRNSYVKGSTGVGGIAGIHNKTGGKMQGCSFEGAVVGSVMVGGLAGKNYCTYIEDCINYGDVWSSGDYAAGIVGNFYAYGIDRCQNYGDIHAKGDNVGGIAGSSDIYGINYCDNYGSVEGNNYVGGIIGGVTNAYIGTCGNRGNVSGNDYVGGICGKTEYGYIEEWMSDISDSYNTGDVSGHDFVGGITGYLNYSNVSRSYSTGNVKGSANVGGLIGKSESIWGHGEVSGGYYLKTESINSSLNGFGNAPDDDGIAEAKGGAFFPVYLDENADPSYDYLGETQNMTVKPESASIVYGGTTTITTTGAQGTVTYSSSDTSIAAVDESTGVVTAKGVGTATIKVTAAAAGNYKEATRSVTIKVTPAEQSLKAKAAASTVAVGKTTTVSVTGAKESPAITYTSSDTAIATVGSTTGKVTAKKVGTVTITATAAKTANYKSAKVTVTIKVVPGATSSVTTENLSDGIKVTWKKVTGARGYYVYRDGKQIKKITSGATLTYKDTGAKTNGTKYTYKVTAYAGTGTSTLSKTRTTYYVSRPAIATLTTTKGKMTVTWKKNAKANGYQVQYSLKSDFSSGNKTVTVTSASTLKKVISSLTSGKTYYVRIRTYKTVSGTKYYSAWSAKKSIKVK